MKKYLFLGCIGLFGINASAYAGWPTFHVITQEQIQRVTTPEGCPSGEERIPQGTKIQIQVRDIPPRQQWFWEYSGRSECFPSMSNLQYLSLQQTGRRYPSTITTNYGVDGVNKFQFVFHIPNFPWECGTLAKADPPIYVACAYDE